MSSEARLPHQDFRYLTRFIGRAQELDDVNALLDHDRLVTITGVGGCGKTRLAWEVLVARSAAYPGGVCVANLGSISDPAQVLTTMVMAVGGVTPSDGDLLAALLARLGAERTLLVLDSCEHVIAACAQLVTLLLPATPGLHVLATSRQPLHIPGECVYRLSPLRFSTDSEGKSVEELLEYEGIQLLVDRASLAVEAFRPMPENIGAIVQICRRLDGLPLAIELAATRMKMFSPQEIAAWLDRRFHLLVHHDYWVPSRQQTLLSTVEWSYHLLKDTERRAWRVLSVFPGSFTFAAADGLLTAVGLPEGAALELVAALIDASVLNVVEQREQTRYRMLETIRHFGEERLWESEEAEHVSRSFYTWVIGLARQVAPQLRSVSHRRQAVARLEGEHENLQAALSWCEENRHLELGLVLASALALYWFHGASAAEGRAWLLRFLEEVPTAPPDVRMQAMFWAGQIGGRLGDYAQAQRCLEQALHLGQSIGDRETVAQTLRALGSIVDHAGDYEGTRSLMAQALACFAELGDKLSQARILNDLGTLASRRDDVAVARPYYEQALPLVRALDSKADLGATLFNLGRCAMRDADLHRSLQYFDEALALARRTGDEWLAASVKTNMGMVACRQKEYSRATDLYKESLATFYTLGAKEDVAGVMESMAALPGPPNAPDRGAVLLGAADAIREALGVAGTPDTAAGRAPTLAALGGQVAADLFESAFLEGRAMTYEQAVQYAWAGHQTQFPAQIGHHTTMQPGTADLSQRELEILPLIAKGYTAREIGQRLHLSHRTIERYRDNIRDKLGLDTRSELVHWAMANGLMDPAVG